MAAAIGLIACYVALYFRSWEQVGFNPKLWIALLGILWPALLVTWPGIIWLGAFMVASLVLMQKRQHHSLKEADMQHKELTEIVIGCAFPVFTNTGYGFLEQQKQKQG